MTAPIGTYDGLDVLGVDLILTGTGDGLSDAMSVEPITLRHGETIFIVGTARVINERYPFAPKREDALRRQYVARAIELHVVDEAEIGSVLAAHHEAVKKGLDSIKGQTSIDDDPLGIHDDEESELD